MDYLAPVFRQVALKNWYPELVENGLTFKTASLRLTESQSSWLLERGSEIAKHFLDARAQSNDEGAAPSTSNAALAAAHRLIGEVERSDAFRALAAAIDETVAAAGLGAFMVKVGEVCPKDSRECERAMPVLFKAALGVTSMALGPPPPPSKRGSDSICHNPALQAYVRAKAMSLRCVDGAGALRMILNSERAVDELQRVLLVRMFSGSSSSMSSSHDSDGDDADGDSGDRGARAPSTRSSGKVPHVTLHFREWCEDLDPALEFRCFVSTATTAAPGKPVLVGVTQMATMNVTLCYPQLWPLRDFLRREAIAFFELPVVQAVLRKVGQQGARREQFVVDIAYSFAKSSFVVVELNPFETSSGGHLFRLWSEPDRRVLIAGDFSSIPGGDGLPELRLHRCLSVSDSLEGVTDRQWRALLSHSGDTYGSVAINGGDGAVPKHHKTHLVVIASGKPADHPDVNRAEVCRATLRWCRTMQFLCGPYLHISLLGYNAADQLDKLIASESERSLFHAEIATKSSIKRTLSGGPTPCSAETFVVVLGHGCTDHGDLFDCLTEIPVVATNPPRTASGMKLGGESHSGRFWLQLKEPDVAITTGSDDIREDDPRFSVFKEEIRDTLLSATTRSKRVSALLAVCFAEGLVESWLPVTRYSFLAPELAAPESRRPTEVPASIADGRVEVSVVTSAYRDVMSTTWVWEALRRAVACSLLDLRSPSAHMTLVSATQRAVNDFGLGAEDESGLLRAFGVGQAAAALLPTVQRRRLEGQVRACKLLLSHPICCDGSITVPTSTSSVVAHLGLFPDSGPTPIADDVATEVTANKNFATLLEAAYYVGVTTDVSVWQTQWAPLDWNDALQSALSSPVFGGSAVLIDAMIAWRAANPRTWG